MDHLLLLPDSQGIARAAKIIQEGGLVAFPTETVYGLGANALNEEAVKSIFTAKGRPLTDPLIVHIAEPEQAFELIDLQPAEMDVFTLLATKFWPGPLTLIVKASSKIPMLVTANTGFVGVRCPKHPLAVSLLRASGLPIAAPSANRFGHVSPTTAAHVVADLGCKGVHVLNGEHLQSHVDTHDAEHQAFTNCEYGIESSVVKIDVETEQLIIFRQGAVNQQQLENCLASAPSTIGKWKVAAIKRAVKMSHTESSEKPAPHADSAECAAVVDAEQESLAGQQAPGQAITHYAPDVPCFIVQKVTVLEAGADAPVETVTNSSVQVRTLSVAELQSSAVLVDFHGAFGALHTSALAYRDLSPQGSAAQAARHLFDTLRWSEGIAGAKYVFIAAIPDSASSSSGGDKVHQMGVESEEKSDISGEAGVGAEADMTLGLADRIFRAASGVAVELMVLL